MRAHIVHVVAAAAVMLALAACSDERPLAPKTPPNPEALLEPVITEPIYLACRPWYPCPDPAVEISAGAYYTCARTSRAKVYCWGSLGGKLLTQPTLIFSGATKMDAGMSHACALDASGQAFCWGDAYNGSLGNGQYTATAASPTPVCGAWCGAPPIQFTSISAGSNSTCGTAVDGIYCWGAIVNSFPSPNHMSLRNDYNAITVGYQHACAWVTPPPSTGSSLDCWGLNNFGQAGKDPTQYPTVRFTTPTYVFVSGADAGNGTYTCANQIYGSVQCFGLNSDGQLGTAYFPIGSFTGIPRLVGDGSLPSGLHGVAVAQNHACAIDQGNVAYCWGANNAGEIGNGSFSFVQFQTPQRVQTSHTFTALAAGVRHSCGIAEDRHVYCWGDNAHGQLGSPGPRETFMPTPVADSL